MDNQTKDQTREGAAERPSEHTDAIIEREHMRSLSTSSQGHICPRCSKAALVRVRRPFYVRPLKRFGLDLRSYRCAMCGCGATIRHRS
jgi:DNA-directed RNA polymerase subunit RPC12/RpoP